MHKDECIILAPPTTLIDAPASMVKVEAANLFLGSKAAIKQRDNRETEVLNKEEKYFKTRQ